MVQLRLERQKPSEGDLAELAVVLVHLDLVLAQRERCGRVLLAQHWQLAGQLVEGRQVSVSSGSVSESQQVLVLALVLALVLVVLVLVVMVVQPWSRWLGEPQAQQMMGELHP